MSEVRPILIHASIAVRHGEHILLVQEAKEENYGRWNLPGGHLEIGESLLTGARREMEEETGMPGEITGLVGIYSGIGRTGFHAIRFVFAATTRYPELAKAGDQILAVRWWDLIEAKLLADKDLVSPAMIRQIIDDSVQTQPYSLSLLKESLP
jgi:8-oxo-dGTP diphosphatase